MLAIAILASLCVVVLLVTILWLSFTDGTPGDPDLGYTLGHYADDFLRPLHLSGARQHLRVPGW